MTPQEILIKSAEKNMMETTKEFLMKYGICSDTTIGIEGDKKLTELLEEYAIQVLLDKDCQYY